MLSTHLNLTALSSRPRTSVRVEDLRLLAYVCSLHHLRNGDEFVAFAPVASQDPVAGLDAPAAVGPHAAVSTVVQQDDIASANLPLGVIDNFFGGLGLPVVAGDVPHDGIEAKSAHGAQRCRTAPAEGRPKELWLNAGRVEDRLLRLLKLVAHLGLRSEDQVGMVPGVAA